MKRKSLLTYWVKCGEQEQVSCAQPGCYDLRSLATISSLPFAYMYSCNLKEISLVTISGSRSRCDSRIVGR
jgi:hypothetical protein